MAMVGPRNAVYTTRSGNTPTTTTSPLRPGGLLRRPPRCRCCRHQRTRSTVRRPPVPVLPAVTVVLQYTVMLRYLRWVIRWVGMYIRRDGGAHGWHRMDGADMTRGGIVVRVPCRCALMGPEVILQHADEFTPLILPTGVSLVVASVAAPLPPKA